MRPVSPSGRLLYGRLCCLAVPALTPFQTRVVVATNLPFHARDNNLSLGASIAKVPHLRDLHLKGVSFTSRALQVYAGAPSLERVFVYQESTYDGSVKAIEAMALKDPRLARKLVHVPM